MTFLEQQAHGLRVWQEPFVALRAPLLTNLRMDPIERAEAEHAMGYQRWFADHMYAFAPAAAYVAQWLQSFREFPPRQKPGSFNLDRVWSPSTRRRITDAAGPAHRRAAQSPQPAPGSGSVTKPCSAPLAT